MAERKVSTGASSKIAKKQLQDIVDPIRTSIDQLTNSISGMVKDLNVVFDQGTKGAKNQTKAISGSIKAIDLFHGEIGKLQQGISELTGDVTKMALSTDKGFDTKPIKGYLESLNKVSIGIEDLKDEIKSKGELEGKELDALNAKLKEQEKIYQELQQQIIANRDATHDTAKAYEETGKGMGYAKDMLKFWKASPGSILKSASAAKEHAEELGKIGEKYKGMPGALGNIGSAAKRAGSMLGGLTKLAIPLAILSGIFAAAKAIWDLGMKADAFVKNANKGFASVRGPDIMTTDVAAQFKKFNDQIYSTAKNLQVGLNADEVRGFLQSIVQAGTNLGKLETGMLSYRDAVYVAAKASRSLGLDLPYVGSMVAELINNFRLGMDKIDETFTQIAFDARKAGLSADRFWGVIQNASASLSLYNVAIGAASKTMTRFSEDMVGGADDAAKATEDMFQVFKSGSMSSQAALLDFAKEGGADVNKMFSNLSEKFKGKTIQMKGRIQLLEAKKDRTSTETEELKKLRAEMYADDQKALRYQKMIGANSVTQATEMGALAEDAPELLLTAIKRMAGVEDLTQISGDRMWVAIKALEKQGVSEKVVRMLVEESGVTARRIQDLSETSNKYFSKALSGTENSKKDLVATLEQVGSTTGDAQIEAAQLLSEQLEATGMPPDVADDWAQILKTSKNTRSDLVNLLTNQGNVSLKGFLDSKKLAKLNNTMTKVRFTDSQKTDNQMAKMSEDTFKDIRDQTLSFEEMLKIGKDEVQWRAYNIKGLTSINKGVFDIYKVLIDKFFGGDYKTEEQKNAAEHLKVLKDQNSTLGGILQFDKDGNISLENQQKAIAEVVRKTEDLKKSIALGTAVNKVIADTKQDPKALERNLKDLYRRRNIEKDPGKKEFNEALIKELEKIKDTSKSDAVYGSEPLQKLAGLKVGMSLRPGKTEATETATKSAIEGAISDLNASIAKEKDPGAVAAQKSVLKELEGINSSMGEDKDKKWKEFQKRLTNKGNSNLDAIEKTNQSLLEDSTKQLTQMTNAAQYLVQLNGTNAETLKWQEILVKSNPEAMKYMAAQADALAKTMPYEEVAKKMNTSMEDIQWAYLKTGNEKDAASAKKIGERMTATGYVRQAPVISPLELPPPVGLPPESPPKQGLRNPMQVTKPTMATLLHRGEWILPKNITPPDMAYTTPKHKRTWPGQMPGQPDYRDFGGRAAQRIKEVPANPTPAAAPGGAAQKSITINVNATEKDLAQRIANEIRGVLYKEQLTGMR